MVLSICSTTTCSGDKDGQGWYSGRVIITREEWDALVKRVEALEDRGKVLARTKSKRGARLPEDYVPPEEKVQQMMGELGCTKGSLAREHRKFKDWFLSAPGQKGVKVDWDRAWCNWMRGASERGSLRKSPTVADKSRGWMELEVAEGE